MAYPIGPIQAWHRGDTIPTTAEGGYAGAASTAAAVGTSLAQSGQAVATVDNLTATATTLPAGASPTVTVTGAIPNKVINIGVPRGADGAPGMGHEEGQQLLAQNQTTLTAAQAAQALAADSADRAENAEGAAFAEPDEAMAVVVGNRTTETRGALEDAFATGKQVHPAETAAATLARLQSAVDAAAPLGVPVIIMGDHVVNGTVTVPTGSKIEGRGTLTQSGTRQAGFFVPAGVSNVTIQNVVAYGLSSDYANESSVYAASAVYVQAGATDVDIVGCKFYGWAGMGVRVNGDRVRVLDCTLVGPGAQYITSTEFFFGHGVGLGSGAKNVTVQGCDISQYVQGINTGKASGLHIVGNRVHHIVGQHGFYLGQIDNAIISENLVHDCALLGMKIQLASGADNDSRDVVISNNVFRDVGTQGILLTNIEATAHRLRNITVSGNVITRAGLAAIEVSSCVGVVVSGNVATQCQSLLRLSKSSRVKVANNEGFDSTRSGMVLETSSLVTVEFNVIDGVASANNSGDRSGIMVNAGNTDLTVRGNRVRDSGGLMPWGINVGVGAGMSTHDYIDNDVSGAFQYGWRSADAGQATRTFRGNRFEGGTAALFNAPTNYAQNADTSGATLAALETEVNELKAVLRANGLVRT